MDGEASDVKIGTVSMGAPAWITVAAINDTIAAFKADCGRDLTPAEASEILLNMGSLFSVLKPAPTKTTK